MTLKAEDSISMVIVAKSETYFVEFCFESLGFCFTLHCLLYRLNLLVTNLRDPPDKVIFPRRKQQLRKRILLRIQDKNILCIQRLCLQIQVWMLG